MNREYYDKIADIMLFGVSFKEGDKLNIQLDFDCREAAKSLTAKAYDLGAAYVDLRYMDTFLHSEPIRAGITDPEYPEYLKLCMAEISGPAWKSVTLMSGAEADVYEKLDGKTASEYFKSYQKIRNIRLKPVMNDEIAWTLTYLPSVDAAKKVFPKLSPEDALSAYWKEVIKIMRLDLSNPVKFWKDKFKKDAERSRYLNELSPEYLEFKGPGTDFKVGLNMNTVWVGGMKAAKTGDMFNANIPTDEIFTSPDWRKADGRVALTRPFVMHQNLGAVPVNAWFEFKDGRVVDYGADEGKDSLDTLFARDERARYLGEVALVDPQSPFAASGLTFYNGLYDENAACHLALGAAYPSTLKNSGHYPEEQLLELGMNVSAIHEDMMIGSAEVDVTAICSDGRGVEIIRDGKFLI
jgi:aminopeptidase